MDLGLEIFFVLSGFLIFRPFVLAQLSGKPSVSTRRYLRRRVLRIFPGYWFALVMAFVLFGEPVHGLDGAVVFLGLLQSFVPNPDLIRGGIEQSWTLMTELSFYVMLPVFAAVVARDRPGPRRRWPDEGRPHGRRGAVRRRRAVPGRDRADQPVEPGQRRRRRPRVTA